MALRCNIEKGDTSCPDVLALAVPYFPGGDYLRCKVVVSTGSVIGLVVLIEAHTRTEIVQYQVLICAFQLTVFRLDIPMGHFFLNVAQMEG